MAAQPQVTDLFKTLGARIADAHNAAKDVPVNTGGGIGLPDGVRGVAQLTVMEFIEGKKEDDKGKYYFRAAGVVVTPDYHDGIKCAGKHTSVLIPFFDTPKRSNVKSFSVPNKDGKCHWTTYRDLFAKLGVQPPPEQQAGETKDAASARVGQYYQGAQQILLQQRPYFEFHTWKGEKATEGTYKGKEPMVQEFWDGRVEYTPPSTSAAVNPAAGVGPAPSTNGQTSNHAAPPAAAAPPPPVQQPAQPPVAAAPTAVTYDDAQLIAWAEAADCDGNPPETDEGKEGVTMLSAACKQVGVTNDEARAAADWAAVAALIKSKSAASAVAATGTSTLPVKGAMVTYGGQQCEVTSVNAEAKTVTLRGPDKKAVLGADKKLLKVGFAELA